MVVFILSSPPLPVAQYGRGAYRAVQKSGVHSYGLFSLIVKTCTGCSQAHCRDSIFRIHEMSKRQKKKDWEEEQNWGRKGRTGRIHQPTLWFKELPIVIGSEAISHGWGVWINEPLDQWKPVKSYLLKMFESNWEDFADRGFVGFQLCQLEVNKFLNKGAFFTKIMCVCIS